MVGRYRRSQEGNRSRFYFLLSIVFIFVVVKWGFPLFIKIIAGDGAEVKRTEEDFIPPQPPILSALPEATNGAEIIIEGYTEGGVNIELNVNDVLNKTDKSKDDGFFSLSASLQNGTNRIQIRAIDGANNASLSEVKLVSLDKEPLTLSITSPKDGTEYIGKNSQAIEIIGKVNKPNTQVLANNSFVDVARDGSFTHKLQLSNGDNNIKIIASDKAGNKDEVDLKLTYSP